MLYHSPGYPSLPGNAKRSRFIHTLAPQAASRVEPEFSLSLWIRVRRDMLARVVTASGHRGPGDLKPLRPSSRQAPF